MVLLFAKMVSIVADNRKSIFVKSSATVFAHMISSHVVDSRNL